MMVHWKHGAYNVSLILHGVETMCTGSMGHTMCLLYCMCGETMVHWKHGAYNVSLILMVC